MSLKRWATKVDRNQPEIVTALRKVGATVHFIGSAGPGTPDLLVGYRMETFLLEVKDPTKPPSARKLTPAQVGWHRDWRGRRVDVVETTAEAFIACKVTTTHRRDAGFPVTPPGFDSASWRGLP